MAETGKVPIQESVGAALRYARENWRFVLTLAAIGAGASTLLSGIALAAAPLGLFTSIAATLVQAFVYAALTAGALYGADAVRGRWTTDGGRVWAAMAIIGLFLFIVMFVASIIVTIVLFSGPLGRYASELEGAGSNQGAVMDIMLRFAEENPGAMLAVMLFYAAVWLILTSRLYLAAPASVDRERILTFETWKWTEGATLRIIAARVLLLAPANILANVLGYLAGRVVGIDTLDFAGTASAAAANPSGFLVYGFASAFITLALYSSLEAGLSSYLYRGLKPPEAPQPGL